MKTLTAIFLISFSFSAFGSLFVNDKSSSTDAKQEDPAPAKIVIGNPIGLNGNIANSPIQGKRVALPFVAKVNGQVSNMRWWVRNGKGYSGGDGGQVRITIEEDSAGEPSGTLVRGSQGIDFFADLQNDTEADPQN